MTSFHEFLVAAAGRGDFVNVDFEERVFQLLGTLDKLTGPLEQANIPYELIGGLAVFIHVELTDPAFSRTTKDIDLMIRRSDFGHVIELAEKTGFRFRHAAGVDLLLYGDRPGSAIHFVFSEEKVRPDYLEPAPALSPARVRIHGAEISIVPVADLVRMKLTSNRLRDQVHIQDLDAAGLITPAVEAVLRPELRARLERIRESE